MKNQIVKFATLGLTALSLAHCGASKDSSYDSSTAQVVGGAVAGAASSSDDSGGSNVSYLYNSPAKPTFNFMSLLLPRANATACSTGAKIKGSACTGSSMSINFNDCTTALGLVDWSGTMALAYNSGAACMAANGGGLVGMGAGNSVTLTSAGGVTRSIASGAYVTTDSGSSGFNSAESGGTVVTCVDATCGGGGAGASRTVDILGVHRTLYSATGSTVFDHTLSTSTPFTINGVGANKQISAGTLVLQHNLAHFVATTDVNSMLTFTSGCCWPVSGSVTTTFSNGASGSETLTFGPSCGTGTVVGSGGGSASVTFTQCQ